MAHIHEDLGTTLVTDERNGVVVAFIALLAVGLVGFLIWLFAFSGIVMHNGNSGSTTRVVQNNTSTNTGSVPSNGSQPAPALS